LDNRAAVALLAGIAPAKCRHNTTSKSRGMRRKRCRRVRPATSYGPPTVPARTADGTVLLHYDFDPNDPAHALPDRRVTAIYLDGGGRVERMARYGVQDGKIVDSVSGRNLTDGSEFLFLETILFDKPHSS
jgi:hypothetical protein